MAARHVQVGDVTGAGRVQKNGSAGGDLLAAVSLVTSTAPGTTRVTAAARASAA